MTSSQMPRPKGENDDQASFTLPGAWVVEVDELAKTLSQPGAKRTRSDVMRMALRRGIDVLRSEAKSAKAKR